MSIAFKIEKRDKIANVKQCSWCRNFRESAGIGKDYQQ